MRLSGCRSVVLVPGRTTAGAPGSLGKPHMKLASRCLLLAPVIVAPTRGSSPPETIASSRELVTSLIWPFGEASLWQLLCRVRLSQPLRTPTSEALRPPAYRPSLLPPLQVICALPAVSSVMALTVPEKLGG